MQKEMPFLLLLAVTSRMLETVHTRCQSFRLQPPEAALTWWMPHTLKVPCAVQCSVQVCSVQVCSVQCAVCSEIVVRLEFDIKYIVFNLCTVTRT